MAQRRRASKGKVMDNYQILVRQQRELEEKVLSARKREIGHAIAAIARTAALYGITIDEIRKALPKQMKTGPRGKYVPKYIDPQTGRTWSGRGRPPKWLADKNADDFLLATSVNPLDRSSAEQPSADQRNPVQQRDLQEQMRLP